MPEQTRVNGIAAAAIAAGVVFAYAGVKGYSIPQTLQNLVIGKSPAQQAQVTSIGTPAGGSAGGGSGANSGSTSGLAAVALSKVGKITYHFGGPPPPGTFDCSSFSSDCMHEAGIDNIPGGTWEKVTNNGASHGPSTISYLSWSGAQTVGHHSSAAVPGDLCVWQTHMGICTGANEMVSAQNERDGCKKSQIDGFIKGELLFIRRIIIGNPHA